MFDDATSLVPNSAESRANFAKLVRRWRASPVGIVGSVMVFVVVMVALLTPLLAPHDPTEHNRRQRFLPPIWMDGANRAHPLGTDQLGRDVLSRILYGSRISVIIGVSAAVIGGTLGAVIGLIAGLYGGLVDTLISRAVDTFLSIPFIILVLAVVGILGPSLLTLILVLGVTGWASYARVIRGETLSVKEREYVSAAQSLGASNLRVAFRHVLPNTFASLIVLATLDVASTILAETSLSYLGLGVQRPTVTWGLMIADGREYLSSSWWLAVFPGLAISFTVLGVIFLGDFLRDILDPKLGE
jgi:peptide/nickel transport system permease protein